VWNLCFQDDSVHNRCKILERNDAMKHYLLCTFFVCLNSVQALIIPRTYHEVSPLKLSTFSLQNVSPMRLSMPLSSLMISDTITTDTAFSDSIVTFDDSVRNMIIVFTVFVALLTGIKLLTGQMDQAIEQVLIEFESTMKRFYPQRWQVLAESLEGLEGDAREVKLLSIMDELQSSDPEFMARVKEKMNQKYSNEGLL
jgi:hypothetical protein